MDKQEIQNVMEKISAQEPVQIQRAIGFVGLSYGLMTAGITFWFLLFFSGTIYSNDNTLMLSFIGSSLVGVTLFFYSIGTYYYYVLHNKHLPIHWFLQGLMRTIIQFYYFGSILLLFIVTQDLFPQIGSEFFILYLVLFLPIYIGYMLPRWEKIKLIFRANFFEEPSN
ncbi:MAG: hypothetical protein ACW98F_04870 [Candidatus Hodarchaeales archaeon]